MGMSELRYYCGIDIGFSGAISVVGSDDVVYLSVDMPLVADKSRIDYVAVMSILHAYGLSHVAVEKAQVIQIPGKKKQGVVSMFKYGGTYEAIVAILAVLKIPFTLVSPQTWKKALMPDMPKGKGSSIVRVNQLFPDFDIGKRKKDHGRADSILLAQYAKETKTTSNL